MSFNAKMRNTEYDVNILERLDLGDESADDAPLDDLMSYFVEQKSFSKFVDFRKKLIIAQARKGNGKSAILQWIFYKASENKDNLVIKCRGAELVRSRFALSPLPDSTPNTLIYDWMSRICTLINRELAKKINFALTDNEITLVETAELDGFKQKNIIGALLDRFSLKLNKGSVELVPEKQRIQNEIETLKRQKDFKAIIIIDDLDATFQNKPEECLSLSTFFSACRYLIQDFPGIVIRTSLRTDVWPMIRPLDEALDKVEQYIHEIHWSENDFVQLINKRICHSLNLETESNALDYVFEKSINWGRKTVFNYVVLYTLSYERPRWGIQLCKLALEHALEKNHDRILDIFLFLPERIKEISVVCNGTTTNYYRYTESKLSEYGETRIRIGKECSGEKEEKRFFIWEKIASDTEREEIYSSAPEKIKQRDPLKITIALAPDDIDNEGIYFCDLPTEESTGMNLYVDANFHIRSDRKSIHFDNDYNKKLLDFCASAVKDIVQRVLAANNGVPCVETARLITELLYPWRSYLFLKILIKAA